MGPDQPATSRRNVLKVLSTGAAASLVPTAVSRAQEASPEQIYERARDIRHDSGDTEQAREYLRDHGFTVNSREVTATAPDRVLEDHSNPEPDRDISPQQVDDDHVEGTISISYSPDSVYRWAEFKWEINLEPPTDSGAVPADVVGLYWPSTDYSRIDDSEDGGEFVDLPTDDPTVGALDPNGLAVNYRDFDHHQHQSEDHPYDWDFGSWMDVKLRPEDPDDPPESRLVTAEYTHTWRDVPLGGINDITVGASGLDVSLDLGSDQWTNEWDKDEVEN